MNQPALVRGVDPNGIHGDDLSCALGQRAGRRYCAAFIPEQSPPRTHDKQQSEKGAYDRAGQFLAEADVNGLADNIGSNFVECGHRRLLSR